MAKNLAREWNALPARKREIVGLIAEGLTDKQIGERLGISKGTVCAHVIQIRASLGMNAFDGGRIKILRAFYDFTPRGMTNGK